MKTFSATMADGSTVHYADRKRWLWSMSVLYPLQPSVPGCTPERDSRHGSCCRSCLATSIVNTGHELGHKNSRFERWLAKIVVAVPASTGRLYARYGRPAAA